MRYLKVWVAAAILSVFTPVVMAAEPAGVSRHKNFDAETIWQTATGAGTVTIAGSIRNTRFAAMEDLEMSVTLLGRNGMKIGSSRQILIPRSLRIDDAAKFTLKVPLPQGAKPEMLHFTYRYRANEGDAERPMDIQSFDAPFSAGSGAGP